MINGGENILCYFPRENGWCKLGEMPAEFIMHGKFVPCAGQLYSTIQQESYYRPESLKQVTYNPYSNKCVRLPSLEERFLRKTFVMNGDKMYALMSEPCVMDHLLNWRVHNGRRTRRVIRRNLSGTETEQECESRKHTSFLTKYKPETNS